MKVRNIPATPRRRIFRQLHVEVSAKLLDVKPRLSL